MLNKSILVTTSTLIIINTAVAQTTSKEMSLTLNPIVHEVMVDAACKDVWLSWTTSQGLQNFLSPNETIQLEINGKLEVFFGPTAEKGLRGSEGYNVLSFIENEMLSFTWNAQPNFMNERGDRTFVVIQLADEPEDRTRVKLVLNEWHGKQSNIDQCCDQALFQAAYSISTFSTKPME